MQTDLEFTEIDQDIRLGEFTKSLARLVGSSRFLASGDSIRFSVLRAEMLDKTGSTEQAAEAAYDVLPRVSSDPAWLARVTYVLGRTAYERGDFDASFEFIGRSMLASQQAADASLIAKAQLALLTLFSRTGRSAIPLIPDVRKSVARSGDPHLMVGLRLYFARAEASRQSAEEARRHFLAAGSLLEIFPNLWLQGMVHLGLSVVDSLCGEPRSAIEQANLAIGCAAKSGHLKTELGGLINLSHALPAVGGSSEAKRCVESVLSRAASDVEIRISALDALANIYISDSLLDEAAQVLANVDEIVRASPRFRSGWIEFTIVQTRARLLQAIGSWEAADDVLENAIGVAENRADRTWQNRFALLRLKGLIVLGKNELAANLLSKLEQPQTMDAVCQCIAALAVSSLLNGQSRVAGARIERVRRISESIGTSVGLTEIDGIGAIIRASDSVDATVVNDDSLPPSPDLESAIALLELGGHTHILAREAAAVLEGAGCARALAVVAMAAAGPRIVETRTWTEPEALAAAKKPNGFELIPLGRHRDEPWHIVVEPRPELEHRCTLIAIRKMIGTALTLDQYRRDEKQRAALWPAEALDADPESIWASEEMAEVLSIARRIAPTPLSLLLTGETGTGKEMLARTIHRASDRPDRVFLPFNCAAVPRDMLESQLFGYRKGAFTGADISFQGVIRAATGGTLLLDEIAEVPLDVQPKLLRFLETHEIHPLGEPHPIKVDVRVIAATNAPLEQLVADGRFRADLFYRLNVVRLKLPPLRERREEIPALVDHYLRRHGDEQKKPRLTLGDETLEYLLLYSWPGNVRQLANEVRRMVALAEPGAALTPALLSPEIRASRRTMPAVTPAEPEVRVRIDQPLPAAVQLLEQTMVRSALDRSQGRVEEAARMLGISRKGLFLKRRRWGLHPPS